jgi:hypothetical protein
MPTTSSGRRWRRNNDAAKRDPVRRLLQERGHIARATYLEWGDPTDTRTSVTWHGARSQVI